MNAFRYGCCSTIDCVSQCTVILYLELPTINLISLNRPSRERSNQESIPKINFNFSDHHRMVFEFIYAFKRNVDALKSFESGGRINISISTMKTVRTLMKIDRRASCKRLELVICSTMAWLQESRQFTSTAVLRGRQGLDDLVSLIRAIPESSGIEETRRETPNENQPRIDDAPSRLTKRGIHETSDLPVRARLYLSKDIKAKY